MDAVNEDDHTGFADGYPILLTSEEGLAGSQLASGIARADEPFPPEYCRQRLRSRLPKIRGTESGSETLNWQWSNPCDRCEVTTIDKETLERSKEPLKTLANIRKQKLGAIFGQNVIPLNEGSLRLGMNVEVLSIYRDSTTFTATHRTAQTSRIESTYIDTRLSHPL